MGRADAPLSRDLAVAAAVAAAGLVAVVPHLIYLGTLATAGPGARPFAGAPLHALLRAELASATFVVLVAASSGALLSRRYGLAGLGTVAGLRSSGWHGVAALGVGLVSYAWLGRQLSARLPGVYPTEMGWALARWLKDTVFEELVARFGMMTILCGALKRPRWANLAQALFFTWLGLLGLRFYGLALELTPLLAASALVTLATHLWLGALYARHGLAAAVLAHGGLAAPHLLHAAIH